MRRRSFGLHGKALLVLVMGCLVVPVCQGQRPHARPSFNEPNPFPFGFLGQGLQSLEQPRVQSTFPAASDSFIGQDNTRQRVLDLNKVTGKSIIEALPVAMPANSNEAKKLLADALAVAKEKDQPLNYNAAIILGRLAVDAKDLAGAEVFYRIAMVQAAKLQSATNLVESYGGLIDGYIEAKKYADAGRICKELVDLKTGDGKRRVVLRIVGERDGELDFLEDDAFDAAKRLKPSFQRLYILMLAKQGKYDQALKLADEVFKENNDWRVLETKARVLHEAGRSEESVKVFDDLIDRISKAGNLSDEEREEYLERYRYSLCNVLIDLNLINRASEILEKLIETNPKNPSYYNDLGYIWADKDIRLNEAEKMIRKALELDRDQRKAIPELAGADRDNGAYLDSLGWVFFRQKRYKEAKEVLLKAVEDKSAQHIEIYDHLCDACFELGDRQGAMDAWRRALETAGDSRRDQDRKAAVEKKLQQLK
jgi:tetratricopeptide (TPR) repeat protein